MFIGSIVFVGLGIWFTINPAKFRNSLFQRSEIISIVGLAGILFFGIIGFFIFKKLNDKKLGLIINYNGIIDNSSGVSAGEVSWSDVATIKIAKVFNQKFLILLVDNPEYYINRQTNMVKRITMQMNFKNLGSPICISANGLQCNFQELENILQKKFEEFKSKKTSRTSTNPA